jgi:archaellum component FlaF (FlaF/FlaG flagellin family)
VDDEALINGSTIFPPDGSYVLICGRLGAYSFSRQYNVGPLESTSISYINHFCPQTSIEVTLTYVYT